MCRKGFCVLRFFATFMNVFKADKSPDFDLEWLDINLSAKTTSSSLDFKRNPLSAEGLEDFSKLASIPQAKLENFEKIKMKGLRLCLGNKCNVYCYHRNPSECELFLEKVKEGRTTSFTDLMDDGEIAARDPKQKTVFKKTFFESFKKVASDLVVLEIYGGEPLIQEEFFHMLDLLAKKPNKRLKLEIKTHLNLESKNFKNIIKKLDDMAAKGKIKSALFKLSVVSFSPEKSAYFKPGMLEALVWENIKFTLEKAKSVKLAFDFQLGAGSFYEFKNFFSNYASFHHQLPKEQKKMVYVITSNLVVPWHKMFSFHDRDLKDLVEDIDSAQKDLKSLALNETLKDIKGRVLEVIESKKDLSEEMKNYYSRERGSFLFFVDYLSAEHNLDLKEACPELFPFYLKSKEVFFDPLNMPYEKRAKVTSDSLKKVSSSFCLAKWLHVTLHLHSGQNHSCHHPAPHAISVDDIKVNPGALHNTEQKKEQRKKMLKGERPRECHYCWRVEDLKQNVYSDRVTKSSEQWAAPFLDEVLDKGAAEDIDPRYLELSFSSNCNLMCSYCHPIVSRPILNEYKKHGPYPHEDYNLIETEAVKKMLGLKDEDNPYVEAFWKWFPQVYKGLRVLRITGGEPFLSKHTFKLLEYCAQNENSNLEISINTNLSFSGRVLDQAFESIENIAKSGSYKRFSIWASVDSHGAQAEYIRHGLDYQRFFQACERVLKIPGVDLRFMVTFNILSLPGFKGFLQDALKLKKRYGADNPSVSISYLHEPLHQSILILPPTYAPYVKECVDLMKENKLSFNDWEIHGMERIYQILLHNQETDKTKRATALFSKYFSEHDRRRNTDFIAAFPELADLWNLGNEYSGENI